MVEPRSARRPQHARRRPVWEALEARLLYSADAGPVAVVADSMAQATQALAQPLDAPVAAGAHELAVVDLRVDGAADLITDLQAQRLAGRDIDILTLDGTDDGIGRITQALDSSTRAYDAIHLVSHGASGELELGASLVDLSLVRARADELGSWAAHLTADADLLVYGCDLAQGAGGQSLVGALASLTGADIAASTNPTGSAALGGDWVLEATTGAIETAPLFTVATRQAYAGLLAFTPASPEVQVDTTTSGTQLLSQGTGGSHSATNAAGMTVVVWEDNTSGVQTVRAMRFDQVGNRVGQEITVNTLGSPATQPAVAIDANGNFVVVWTSGGNHDGDGNGVYMRRFDANGTALGTEQRVNTLTAGDQSNADVAIDPLTGNIWVTWQSYTGASYGDDIMAKVYASNGASLGADLQVNTVSWFEQTTPSIAFGSGGSGMITWQSQGLDFSGWCVVGRLITNGTTLDPLGGFIVNLTATGDQAGADVAGDGNGHFVVTWTSTGGVAGTDGVYARVITPASSSGTLEFLVSTQSVDAASTPSVTMRPNGDFVVVWQTQNIDGNNAGISAAELSITGQVVSAAQRINQFTNGNQMAPSVSSVGNLLRVFWSGRSAVDNDGVVMQDSLFDPPAINIVAVNTATINEGSGQAVYQVTLGSMPLAPVTVQLRATDPAFGEVATASLTFDATNWNIAQSFSFSVNRDYVVTGTRTAVIDVVSITSADTFYAALTAASLSQSIGDVDTFNQLVVDTTDDVVDGDVSNVAALSFNHGADGKISLREALLAENATASNGGASDVIRFNLPTQGSQVIQLTTPLPSIVRQLVIDGFSQPLLPTWNAAGPRVGLAGIGTGSGDGLTLSAGAAGSVIQGLSIGGFAGNGLVIGASDVQVDTVYVGVDLSGQGPLGNGGHGILATNAARLVIVNSVVAGNGGAGIVLTGATTAAVITGNRIGTDTVNHVLGNGGDGIFLYGGAQGNRIGGTLAVDANQIVNNGGAGIRVQDNTSATSGNSFLGNVIRGNAFGIYLTTGGTAGYVVTPNDIGDLDTGANGMQNYPVIGSAITRGSDTLVSGTLQSQANTSYRIEVFQSTGNAGVAGQGWARIGVVLVTTDANGQVLFDCAVPLLAYGSMVTATATRTSADGQTFGDTSGFALNVAVQATPVITTASSLSANENTPPAFGLSATDNDSAVSTLTYSIVGGSDAARFALVGGNTLAMVASPDYEAPTDANRDNVYEVTVQVSDPDGNESVSTFLVTVNDVNEAPVLSGPTSASAVAGVPLDLQASQGLAFGLQDPDAVQGPMQLTLTAVNGLVSLSGTQGLSFSTGDGSPSAVMQFTGNLAALQAALSGMRFSADMPATGSLTVTVTDPGVPDLTDTHQLSITIVAANTPPQLSLAAPISMVAGDTVVIDASRLLVTDTQSSASQLVYSVTALPAVGTLSRDSVVLTTGATFTQQDVQDGLIRFVGTSAGSDAISFDVSDSAGGTLSGVTLNLNVAPANQAPRLMQSVDVAATTGTDVLVDASHLQVEDPDGSAATLTYTIASLPANGDLLLNGQRLSAGSQFTQADVDQGRLTFSARVAQAGALVVDVADAAGASIKGISLAFAVTDPAPAPAAAPLVVPPVATTDTSAESSTVRTSESTTRESTAPAPAVMTGEVRNGANVPPAFTQASTQAARTVAPVDAAGHGLSVPERGRSEADRLVLASLLTGEPRAAVDDRLAGRPLTLPASFDRASPVARVALDGFVPRHQDLREALAQVRDQVSERVMLERHVVASSAAVSASLSIGYVIWLLRGGVLVSSLLASIPAWSSIDPLPVFNGVARRRDDGEDDSLQAMLRNAQRKAQRKAAPPPRGAGTGGVDGTKPAGPGRNARGPSASPPVAG